MDVEDSRVISRLMFLKVSPNISALYEATLPPFNQKIDCSTHDKGSEMDLIKTISYLRSILKVALRLP